MTFIMFVRSIAWILLIIFSCCAIAAAAEYAGVKILPKNRCTR